MAVVVPRALTFSEKVLAKKASRVIRNWPGNQSRFSRIKYAFLQGGYDGVVTPEDRIVCVLGPSGKSHRDTVTIHDLSLSWSEEFPFEVKPLFDTGFFHTIMALIDIALEGAIVAPGSSPPGEIQNEA